MNEMYILYQCIACSEELYQDSPVIWKCPLCESEFPIVDEIPVFLMPDPLATLHGFVKEKEEICSSLGKRNEGLQECEHVIYNSIPRSRIESIKQGLADHSIFEQTYKSIADFLQKNTNESSPLAWASVKSGFNFYDMLPYFYQDWSGNRDFEEVKDLFDKAIGEHCKDKTSIAVLGAGACGLVHGLADKFEFSYALDLSLPTLLTAKRLIEGERLIFHLEQADWQRIELLPPPPLTNPIRYLAADVMNMPFKNASMSVVVTQYMLDFASDPGRITEEIYRILKPDGIWINFSNPFRVLDDPIELGRRKLNELPAYFEAFGFDTVCMENKKFTLLNMEKIVAEVGNNKNFVHFFTLKKSEKKVRDSNRQPIRRFFLENEAVWQEIPKLVKGRELTVAHKKKLDGQQENGGWVEFTVMRHSFVVPTKLALLLETLIEHVDGKTTLRGLFTLLQQKGMGLSEKAFMHLVYILHIQHNLISFKDQSNCPSNGSG